MKIEVIEFFPITRDDVRGVLTGTLRVKIPEVGLHILGLLFQRKRTFGFLLCLERKVLLRNRRTRPISICCF